MGAVSKGCSAHLRPDVVAGDNVVLLSRLGERFDGRSPLVLYCHTVNNDGAELNGFHFYGCTMPQFLAAQGFIVIGGTWGSKTNWGNEAAVTAMETARTWAQAGRAKSGAIGLWGDSMGFMTAANYWNEFPANVGRVLGCSPLSHASNFYTDTGAGGHQPDMDAAYSGSFATNGASRSPHVLLPNITGAGSKLRVHYSHLDASLRPADITAMCAAVGVTPVDVEASGASTPSGHTSYLAQANDHGAIAAHFGALK